MKVLITRKNGALSGSLKDYIETTVSELDRHFSNIIDSHVIIDAEGKANSVEITLRVAGRTLVSSVNSANLRAAIDGCVDKLDKQLDKVKGRYRKKGRKSEDNLVGVEAEALEEDMLEFENTEEGPTLLTIEREELLFEVEERTGTAD
ncbi:ribosome-associated translation inhibitor RaiA [bacterium]|nr:ribosome-associated translation inhibitor RaiA [bacterium]